MKTELLHKYLAGECTILEKEMVENWLHSSPQNQEVLDEIQQIWRISPGKRIHVDSHEAWTSFQSRVLKTQDTFPDREPTSKPAEKKSKQYKNHVRKRWMSSRSIMAYAGAVAAIFMIMFLFFNQGWLNYKAADPELSMQEITTQRGQQTTVKLSDGSLVQLNGESKLSVPENYMDGNRAVHLEGEAYFEIVPNPDRKFLVYANNSVTQVLGTKFNVRAYPGEDIVEVVVSEGKVSLSSDENILAPEVQLIQNQRGTFSKNGEIIASNVSDLSKYMDWTKGKLTFFDAPPGVIKNRLERWYDIEVILKDDFSSNDKLLTGSFENAPLSVVLSSIALSLDIDYKQDGSTVIFLKK